MGFLPSPQGLEDLHIQKSMMSVLSVNTMEELRAFHRKLHDLQGQSPIPDQRRSDQIQRTGRWSPKSIKTKDQLGAVFVMNVFICECTS